MPGHILNAVCPCGFSQAVHPGSPVLSKESVIAYDPTKPELVTIDSEEARAKRLVVIRNPYLGHMRRSMWEEDVQQQAQGSAFRCPECEEVSMRFGFVGFWCS